jgi:hypothetical protein
MELGVEERLRPFRSGETEPDRTVVWRELERERQEWAAAALIRDPASEVVEGVGVETIGIAVQLPALLAYRRREEPREALEVGGPLGSGDRARSAGERGRRSLRVASWIGHGMASLKC